MVQAVFAKLSTKPSPKIQAAEILRTFEPGRAFGFPFPGEEVRISAEIAVSGAFWGRPAWARGWRRILSGLAALNRADALSGIFRN